MKNPLNSKIRYFVQQTFVRPYIPSSLRKVFTNIHLYRRNRLDMLCSVTSQDIFGQNSRCIWKHFTWWSDDTSEGQRWTPIWAVIVGDIRYVFYISTVLWFPLALLNFIFILDDARHISHPPRVLSQLLVIHRDSHLPLHNVSGGQQVIYTVGIHICCNAFKNVNTNRIQLQPGGHSMLSLSTTDCRHTVLIRATSGGGS